MRSPEGTVVASIQIGGEVLVLVDEGQLYALDAASGKLLWTFTTEGPVRFSPAAWRDRLFVAFAFTWMLPLG